MTITMPCPAVLLKLVERVLHDSDVWLPTPRELVRHCMSGACVCRRPL